MKTHTPKVIYRTRSLADANSLADDLTARGIQARIAIEKPHGHFGELPVTDFVHEVMAVDFDTTEVKNYVLAWEQNKRDLQSAANEPYCYYCGEQLNGDPSICSACGELLHNAD